METVRARPSREEYFLDMARLVSSRSPCLSKQVGCVLVDSRNHVLATGYNGPASGLPHCHTCARVGCEPGTNYDEVCPSTHAEANALLQCGDVYQISAAYCTYAPCAGCLKLLMNTSCQLIVFLVDYPSAERVLHRWKELGREWRKSW